MQQETVLVIIVSSPGHKSKNDTRGMQICTLLKQKLVEEYANGTFLKMIGDLASMTQKSHISRCNCLRVYQATFSERSHHNLFSQKLKKEVIRRKPEPKW